MRTVALVVLVVILSQHLELQTPFVSTGRAPAGTARFVNNSNVQLSSVAVPQMLSDGSRSDSVSWIRLAVDSGVVHAAVAMPKGKGPFPALIILHGTHGFAQEYVQLARRMAEKGVMGIAVCWFAGRRGAGVRFITPIDYPDAPPFLDAPGLKRFRLARKTIDSFVGHVNALPGVRPGHVALFGHSLGGGAALDYAFTHPGKVQAVLLNSCGFPPEVIERSSGVNTPVLLLHGTADSPAQGGSALTAVERARQFEAALRKANKKVEVKYYEGSDHNTLFTDSAQFNDTVGRLANFLQSTRFK